MKSEAILLVSLSLLASSLAVTVTFYTDNACKTPAASTFQGAPNPNVAPLNKCTQSVTADAGRTALWSKPTVCTSSSSTIQVWADKDCTTTFPTTNTYNVGSCLTTGLPPGALSMQITCSSASAVSAAVAVAISALLFLCI